MRKRRRIQRRRSVDGSEGPDARVRRVMQRAAYCNWEWTSGELSERTGIPMGTLTNVIARLLRRKVITRTTYKNQTDDSSKFYYMWNKERGNEQSTTNATKGDR